MSEFILKTKTERTLYIDALFICLERGSLGQAEATQDLKNLITDCDEFCGDATARQDLEIQIQSVLHACACGTITQDMARETLVNLFPSLSG